MCGTKGSDRMKKFMYLLIMNFRKSIVPMILLAVITAAAQVCVYNASLSYDDKYENSVLYEGTANAYRNPVEFMDDDREDRWNVIGLISLTSGIFLVCFCGREKEENYMVLRNLPVKRGMLWLAKFSQITLSLVLIYLTNYAAMFLQYWVYTLRVKEEYRELFVFWWNNETQKNFFNGLTVTIVIAFIITMIYSIKHYAIYKIKKGGKQYE